MSHNYLNKHIQESYRIIINSVEKSDYPRLLEAIGISLDGIKRCKKGWIKVYLKKDPKSKLHSGLVFNLYHGGWKCLDLNYKGGSIIKLLKLSGYNTNEKLARLIDTARHSNRAGKSNYNYKTRN